MLSRRVIGAALVLSPTTDRSTRLAIDAAHRHVTHRPVDVIPSDLAVLYAARTPEEKFVRDRFGWGGAVWAPTVAMTVSEFVALTAMPSNMMEMPKANPLPPQAFSDGDPGTLGASDKLLMINNMLISVRVLGGRDPNRDHGRHSTSNCFNIAAGGSEPGIPPASSASGKTSNDSSSSVHAQVLARTYMNAPGAVSWFDVVVADQADVVPITKDLRRAFDWRFTNPKVLPNSSGIRVPILDTRTEMGLVNDCIVGSVLPWPALRGSSADAGLSRGQQAIPYFNCESKEEVFARVEAMKVAAEKLDKNPMPNATRATVPKSNPVIAAPTTTADATMAVVREPVSGALHGLCYRNDDPCVTKEGAQQWMQS